MVLPEDSADKCQNTAEYYSNSVTWCMKDSALSVGLIKEK